MDPTIVVGSVFSLKGSQNHLISQQWKEAVKKEYELTKRWKAKYAKHLLDDEQVLLNLSQRKDAEAEKRKQLPRPPERKVLYEGLGRLPYLKQQRGVSPQVRFSKPMTASHEVGWRTNITCDLGFERTEWGKKPIVNTSFFRRSGVF
eukprot:TRINITY_DN25953_c0_g1_i1.p1 TRINITY_DN25953_c0_g1~~TRINITY_DN25953_c0_g1_i1.p1  ORF type:complete len:170 (+),score=25.12 TRINITY_DN25953_c0_g1_i1:72-512(+)